MKPRAPIEVKVCGLRRREDAETASEAGAAFLGVILAPGFGRTVAPEAAAAVVAGLAATPVGVFVDGARDDVARAAEAAGVRVVQLHGDETPETAAWLRARGWGVWKALRPRSADEFADGARRWAGAADALLLDGWSPAAAGGTGTRFDWAAVSALRHLVPPETRLVAAGGMRAGVVAEAAALLRPDVIDVSSGVESAPGVKDPRAVRAFVAAVRALDGTPPPLG
jgi:phosphoribosylanthranilate isomerase